MTSINQSISWQLFEFLKLSFAAVLLRHHEMSPACITKIWTLDKEYAACVWWLMDWASPSWFMDSIPEDRYEFLQVPLMFWAGQSILQAYLKKLIRSFGTRSPQSEMKVLIVTAWFPLKRTFASRNCFLDTFGEVIRSELFGNLMLSDFLVKYQWAFHCQRNPRSTRKVWDFGEENSEFSSAPSLSRQCTEFSDVVAQESWCSCFHDSFWKSRLCSM